jgi:hypothetical protein
MNLKLYIPLREKGAENENKLNFPKVKNGSIESLFLYRRRELYDTKHISILIFHPFFFLIDSFNSKSFSKGKMKKRFRLCL